jgi:two-component system cell cycle response regulator
VAGKILIVDDISTNRIVLKVKLAAAFYQTVQAASGKEAIELARELRPDLILLDINLPDADGIEVCREIKSGPATRGIPIVMVSAERNESMRLSALRAGAEDVFWKPFDDAVLLARLRSILRAREAEQELGLRDATYRELGLAETAAPFDREASVVMIAPARMIAEGWASAIAPHMRCRTTILDPATALLALEDFVVPDVILVAADLGAPDGGLRLLSELRSRRATRFSSICVALPLEAQETAAIALDLGASDLIEFHASGEEMALRLQTQVERKRRADRLRSTVEAGLKLAMTDPLTGLHNRRYAIPHLGRMARRAADSGRSFALMVLDLDRFKTVNDTHGHAAGDAVLVEVAQRFRHNLRSVDLVARFGGEEFVVALPDIALGPAQATAERLRRVVQDQPVLLPGGVAVRVTLSIGLAMGGGEDEADSAVDLLIDRADRALMAAKAEGRNQVTVSRSAA